MLKFINNENTLSKIGTDIVDDDEVNIYVSNIRNTLRINKWNDVHWRNNDKSIDCSYFMHPLKKIFKIVDESGYISQRLVFSKKHIGTSNKNIDKYVCAKEG